MHSRAPAVRDGYERQRPTSKGLVASWQRLQLIQRIERRRVVPLEILPPRQCESRTLCVCRRQREAASAIVQKIPPEEAHIGARANRRST